jgi:DNA-binding NtrC family response regulator
MATNHLMNRTRVLIADDNALSAHRLGDSLTQERYLFEVAPSGDKALDVVRHLACDIVICDVRMAGMSEFELLDQIKNLHPRLPVIVGSDKTSILEAIEAVKHGAFQYLEKPFNNGDLLGFIVEATANSNTSRSGGGGDAPTSKPAGFSQR